MEIILDYIGGAGRQRQVDLSEFKASLICIMTSRLARATRVRSSLPKQKGNSNKTVKGAQDGQSTEEEKAQRQTWSHVVMIRAQECHCHQKLEKARDTRLPGRILLTPT